MKQISGNKLLVKALKEEGVEYLFGYPGACTIDISDELYKQDNISIALERTCFFIPGIWILLVLFVLSNLFSSILDRQYIVNNIVKNAL